MSTPVTRTLDGRQLQLQAGADAHHQDRAVRARRLDRGARRRQPAGMKRQIENEIVNRRPAAVGGFVQDFGGSLRFRGARMGHDANLPFALHPTRGRAATTTSHPTHNTLAATTPDCLAPASGSDLSPRLGRALDLRRRAFGLGGGRLRLRRSDLRRGGAPCLGAWRRRTWAWASLARRLRDGLGLRFALALPRAFGRAGRPSRSAISAIASSSVIVSGEADFGIVALTLPQLT